MAEAAARREARRRKILDNSENRLKKITNLEESTIEGVRMRPLGLGPPKRRVSFSPASTNISAGGSETNTQHSTTSSVRSIGMGLTDISTIFQNPNDDDESVSELEFGEVNYEERRDVRLWIIAALALLTRYLQLACKQHSEALGGVSCLPLGKVFVPFLAFQAIELAFSRPTATLNGLLSSLVSLSARSQHAELLRRLLLAAQLVARLLQDVMLYFFSFVVADLLVRMVSQTR